MLGSVQRAAAVVITMGLVAAPGPAQARPDLDVSASVVNAAAGTFAATTDGAVGRPAHTSSVRDAAPGQFDAPVQTAPPDGAVLHGLPRTTSLTWQPVPGATSYKVEVEVCAAGPYGAGGAPPPTTALCATLCTSLRDAGLIKRGDACGYSIPVVASTPSPQYTFDFVGDQPGRWRVWALDASGHEGPKSPWYEFRYTGGAGSGPGPDEIKPPGGTLAVTLARTGLRFRAPKAWRRARGKPPLVYAVKSGSATVALWRYRRQDVQLPDTHEALVDAKNALVAQVRKRDPTFNLIKAKLLLVSGKRAVQVLGMGTIGESRREIRSTHIYANRAEYVVDAFAPPSLFDRVDRQVFAPLLASVQIVRTQR